MNVTAIFVDMDNIFITSPEEARRTIVSCMHLDTNAKMYIYGLEHNINKLTKQDHGPNVNIINTGKTNTKNATDIRILVDIGRLILESNNNTLNITIVSSDTDFHYMCKSWNTSNISYNIIYKEGNIEKILPFTKKCVHYSVISSLLRENTNCSANQLVSSLNTYLAHGVDRDVSDKYRNNLRQYRDMKKQLDISDIFFVIVKVIPTYSQVVSNSLSRNIDRELSTPLEQIIDLVNTGSDIIQSVYAVMWHYKSKASKHNISSTDVYKPSYTPVKTVSRKINQVSRPSTSKRRKSGNMPLNMDEYIQLTRLYREEEHYTRTGQDHVPVFKCRLLIMDGGKIITEATSSAGNKKEAKKACRTIIFNKLYGNY